MAGKGKGVNGNLISQDMRTPERRREIAAMGGAACHKERAKKKAIKDLASEFLGMGAPLDAAKKARIRKLTGCKNDEITVQFVALLKLVEKAMNGDKDAIDRLITYAGEAPQKSVDITGNVPVIFTGVDDIAE